MADLATTAYLNRGELPVPQPAGGGADPFDGNADGRFSVVDYADDPRVADRNDNGVLDPEDLILDPAFSDGVDSDGNGYVDDISGWDLLNDDNDPLDDVEYGHGTGEARDSTAAHDGTGAFGMCPECVHLPVRVSDSFIAEGGRFAAGVLFALDSGAAVVQEALGAISNPPQAQQAVDAAYDRGVPVVASMADEQSQHANLPAAMNHTIPVNSVTDALDFLGDLGPTVAGRRDTLALNGCTNTGGIAWVSVPSDGCSSEATGNAAGMVGLVLSRGPPQRPRAVGQRGRPGAARRRGRHRLLHAQLLRPSERAARHLRPAAVPLRAGMGRHARLRADQRRRGGPPGDRRTDPSRGRPDLAGVVQRAAGRRVRRHRGTRRGVAIVVVLLPRRVDDGAPGAVASRSGPVAHRRGAIRAECADRGHPRRAGPGRGRRGAARGRHRHTVRGSGSARSRTASRCGCASW